MKDGNDDDHGKRDKELPRIRLTASELDQIRKRAAECELSLSEYVRQIATREKINMTAPRIEREAVMHLLAIGRNLNQITKSGHITRSYDMTELRATLEALNAVVAELMD